MQFLLWVNLQQVLYTVFINENVIIIFIINSFKAQILLSCREDFINYNRNTWCFSKEDDTLKLALLSIKKNTLVM